MKKNILFLTLSLGLIISAVSCKKDEVEPSKKESTLNLKGKWAIQTIEFSDNNVVENVEEDSTSLGYAPYMYSQIRGLNFKTGKFDDTEIDGYNASYFGVEGTPFEQLLTENYWYWNYLDNKKSFEMIQANTSFPPYNFSISNVKIITNNGDNVTFTAEINTKKVDKSYMLDKTEFTTGKFKITKGTPTKNTKIYVGGNLFFE